MHSSPALTIPRSRRRTIAVTLAITIALVAGAGILTHDVFDTPSGDAAEVVVTIDDFVFSARRLEVDRRAVELTLANVDAVTHTFTIQSLDVDLVVGAGEARLLTFDVRAGRYTFMCAIPGHDNSGMRGELVVH